jgi:galactokinase
VSAPGFVPPLRARFGEAFGRPAEGVAFAPGRVNLIGEHTDYNDGFVLPAALERGVAAAFARRGDRRIAAVSVAFGETREIDLDELAPPGGSEWIAYVAGVAWALLSSGRRLSGIDLAIDGDVPVGAGLSSSAALEMAVARALCAASDLPWSPFEMARLGQKAENQYVGVNCGLMDQFASAASRDGAALLLDCRTFETRSVPIPEGAALVVMDTGARRRLAASAYNERRSSCEAAVAALRTIEPGVRALRDADEALLARARDRLDEVTYRRARHVVLENRRPLAMADALGRGDLDRAGALMDESHASLRDLYEVSSPELDLVSSLAREHPACHGARMTGAGFGGCAVALVELDGAPAFIAEVDAAYRSRVDLPSAFFAFRPSAGARLLET